MFSAQSAIKISYSAIESLLQIVASVFNQSTGVPASCDYLAELKF
jgi:hypothetical protein